MRHRLKQTLLFLCLSLFLLVGVNNALADYKVSTENECKALGGNCVNISNCSGSAFYTNIGTCEYTLSGTCCLEEPDLTRDECSAQGGTCREDGSGDDCNANEIVVGECTDVHSGSSSWDDKCCKVASTSNSGGGNNNGGSGTSTSSGSTPSFTYTPLEKIPGFESETSSAIDFPRYMEILFNILLWSVGIAALFMIIVGGFWYLTAAGNTSQLEQAKEIIRDSIIGLLVAFFSWLLLYVINPDLVRLDLSSLTTLKMEQGTVSSHQGPRGGVVNGPGNGSCSTVPSGACSVESLKSTCLSSNAEAFSRLCNKESGGAVGVNSGVDVCDNYGGQSFSGGLFQINVFANGKYLGDSRCNNLGSKGTCANRRASDGVCLGWNCRLNDSSGSDLRYCMGLTHTAEGNIKVACALSNNGSNTTPWACSANKCGIGGTSSNFCK